jgi:hypothetical protein
MTTHSEIEKMNQALKDSLIYYRISLLEYLFDYNYDEIEKWNNNKKVKITERFISFLNGDWSRYNKVYYGVNLSFLLGKDLTKNQIFKILKSELERVPNKGEGDYQHNFNPNWFFLFFEEFYGLELIYINNKEKIETIKLEYIEDTKKVNNKDVIVGIKFLNYNTIITKIRPEIIKIIENHSKCVLNKNILDILGDDNFCEIFIKGCIIQQEIIYNNKKYYTDLCYTIINGNKKKNIILEINENHHNKISDFNREINILSSKNSESRIINYNLKDNDLIDNETIYKQLIINFAKSLYDIDKIKSVLLYLTEIDNLPLDKTLIGIQMRNNILTMTLSKIINLPYFDEATQISIIDIIYSYIHNNHVNIEKDFTNHKIIKTKKDFNNYNLIESRIEDLIHNMCEFEYIKNDDILTLKNKLKNEIRNNLGLELFIKSEELILTSRGIKNIILSIDGDKWTRKQEYIDYIEELEQKYEQTINYLLSDNSYEKLSNDYLVLSTINSLGNFDSELFFDNIKKCYNSKESTKLFHNKIPYIIREENSYVDYNRLASVLSKELRGKLDIEFLDDGEKYRNNHIIVNFRLMSYDEVKKIYNVKNHEPEFLD